MRRIYFILSLLYLATLFTSCKDDEKDGFIISPKEMNLVAGETKTIKVNGGVSGYDFISGNQYIASVENDGVITALRVGQTDIRVRDKNNSTAKCRVKVTGKNKMYIEPCMKFESGISQVKSFEKRTLKREDSETLYYSGENPMVYEISYSFINNKLIGSSVLIPGNKTNAELLGRFIAERYIIIKIEDSNIYFISVDQKIIGGITAGYKGSKPYYLVVYASAQIIADRSSTVDISDIKEKVNEIKNGIKL